jgi:2-dehydro-3-deoxy-D-gluconate 5-dehydrogenase
MAQLRGKVAVVTGGRRGIGLAMATALSQSGADVVAIAKSSDRGELPHPISYVGNIDLASCNDRNDLLKSAISGRDRLDILINNAAIAHAYAALDYPMDEWRRIIEINLTAVFDLSRQAVLLGCTRIVNIASISAFNGARNVAGYAATKHAMLGLTKCLSNEWSPRGVTVNNIAPGFIETDMLQLNDPGAVLGRIPVGRFGSPQDVAAAMLFLVSDESGYVTGSTIMVDGGWLGR